MPKASLTPHFSQRQGRRRDASSHLARGRLSLLSLALAGTFPLLQPSQVQASTINSAIPGSYNVTSGELIITDTGMISGATTGVAAGGIIASVSNSGTIVGSKFGLHNYAGSTISTLNNSGSIWGRSDAIANYGVIGTLINSGSLSGSIYGVTNGTIGTIGTLSNSNAISAGHAINNYGSIGTLNNSGTLSGNEVAIWNDAGSIGMLNNSGTISGLSDAIYSTSSIGGITNTGVIAGRIYSSWSGALTITGGSGTTFGTLTGYGGVIGNIVSAGDWVFGGGNQLLNDNIMTNGGSGTVTNAAGVLQVNNHLTISGNYVQDAAATLAIGVSSAALTNGVSTDTGYGRLIVNGNATIAAGAGIGLKTLTSYAYATGQRFVVVQAYASGSTYNAGSLVYTVPGYNASGSQVLDSDDSSYTDLIVTVGDVVSGGNTGSRTVATNGNANAILSSLFNYSGTNQNLLNVFNPALALTNVNEANRAGAQLSPTATNNAAINGSVAAFNAVQGAVGGHIDSLRTAHSGSAANSGIATGESSLDPALWGRFFGGMANQGERDGISGYHAGYGGLMIGADAQVLPDWRVGGLFSYAHINVANDGDNSGSSAQVNGYGLTAYAGYDGKPWYINLTAGVARQQYSTTRAISYTGFSGTANASFNGMLYTTTVQAGYPLAVGDTTVTPLTGMSYSSLHQDGYTETGGSGAGLMVNASSLSSLKSELGAKLERTLTTSYGQLQPFVQLAWHHEFHDGALRTSGIFAADTTSTTAFTTQGASPLRNTAQLSLGATLLRSENLTLSARYTLEGARGYTAQTGDLTLRWKY